MQHIQINTKIE